MTAQNLNLSGVDLRAEIERLRKDRNAVILAHYYQKPELQDLADFVGDSLELSRFFGRPYRLFLFTRQGLTWRFCTTDTDQEAGGNDYLSAQIDRSEIRQTVERDKDKIKITLAYLRDPTAAEFPVTQSLGDNWHPYAPSDTIRVVCMASHVGSLDPPDERDQIDASH